MTRFKWLLKASNKILLKDSCLLHVLKIRHVSWVLELRLFLRHSTHWLNSKSLRSRDPRHISNSYVTFSKHSLDSWTTLFVMFNFCHCLFMVNVSPVGYIFTYIEALFLSNQKLLIIKQLNIWQIVVNNF